MEKRLSLRQPPERKSNLLLPKMLVVVALSTVSLAFGVIPDGLQQSSTGILSNSAYAQSISDTEVKNYARAVLAIEPIRQAAYNEIKKLVGSGDIPAIVCNKQNSLNNLPGNTRSIAVNYCNQSKKIVESNNLTIPRFNAITMKVQEDSELEKRIQAELIRLQKSSASPTP